MPVFDFKVAQRASHIWGGEACQKTQQDGLFKVRACGKMFKALWNLLKIKEIIGDPSMISFFVIIHLVLIYIHLYCSLSPSSTINITEKKSFFPLFLLINLFGIFHPQSSFPAAVNSLKGRATSLATNSIFKDPINQKKILTQSCPHSITYWSREQIWAKKKSNVSVVEIVKLILSLRLRSWWKFKWNAP